MCSPSQVQTPLSTHSVQLLLLLTLIVPLYFIAIFTVRETSTVNRIGSFEKLLSPPLKMSTTEINFEIFVFDGGGGRCHLQYDHQMELVGAASQSETFTLKTSLVVTFQEMMGLPPSFGCLVEFHLKVL